MTTTRLSDLLAHSSVEVQARDGIDPSRLKETFAPGTEVSITFLPGEDHRQIAAAARGLAAAGYVPMPHISARALASRGELDDLLARVTGEAGADRVLVIAGDAAAPRGPFGCALDLLSTGAFAGRGLATIALAGHPEGNPNAPDAAIRQALTDKVAFVRGSGLEPRIITQFAFEAAPILAYLETLATLGAVDVHVGVAGPANPATLLKFALRCGVGNSVRTLRKRAGTVGRLFADAGPDELVRELAAAAPDNVKAFHLFPFGELKKTGAWLEATRAQRTAAPATTGA